LAAFLLIKIAFINVNKTGFDVSYKVGRFALRLARGHVVK
jgi:hypothetical protein